MCGLRRFQRVQYTVHVHSPFAAGPQYQEAVQALQESEQELLQERSSMGAFEQEFLQVMLARPETVAVTILAW